MSTKELVLAILDLGITKWAIHRYVGCTYQQVTNWEKGKSNAYIPYKIKLFELYARVSKGQPYGQHEIKA